jgi:hypothetical protein
VESWRSGERSRLGCRVTDGGKGGDGTKGFLLSHPKQLKTGGGIHEDCSTIEAAKAKPKAKAKNRTMQSCQKQAQPASRSNDGKSKGPTRGGSRPWPQHAARENGAGILLLLLEQAQPCRCHQFRVAGFSTFLASTLFRDKLGPPGSDRPSNPPRAGARPTSSRRRSRIQQRNKGSVGRLDPSQVSFVQS